MINLTEPDVLNPNEFTVLEALVKAAMFDPSAKVRATAVQSLRMRYGGCLRKGFLGDNQIMVEFQQGNSVSILAYVCDVPKEYLGAKPEFHSFKVN